MAFAKERKKPDGSIYYEIRAYNKEKKHYYTKYYYPPDGWSARSVKKQLQRPICKVRTSSTRSMPVRS